MKKLLVLSIAILLLMSGCIKMDEKKEFTLEDAVSIIENAKAITVFERKEENGNIKSIPIKTIKDVEKIDEIAGVISSCESDKLDDSEFKSFELQIFNDADEQVGSLLFGSVGELTVSGQRFILHSLDITKLKKSVDIE